MALLPSITLSTDPLYNLGASIAAAWTRLLTGPLGGPLRPIAALLKPFGFGVNLDLFVLSIGDEGATLVQLRRGRVIDALFAAADAEEGLDSFRELLGAMPDAQIVVMADVLEQMYREDTVPKVGIFDRAQVVRRRLDLIYPNDELKAALPYKRQRGQATPMVMFAALPTSPNLSRWIEFLNSVTNPEAGFFLLPYESADIARKLGPSTEGETRRVWRALISQQAASGYRQVFESEGKLIVTRLTQRPNQEMNAQAEAMLIERELRSSISYVKRLGFADAHRLDVVVLADPAVCRAVDERELPATTVTALTPYQAGVMAGFGDIGREDSPFSDVLLALWTAAKRRHRLVLPTRAIRESMRMATITRWGAVATFAFTLLSLWYIGSMLVDFASGAGDASALNAEIKHANQDLNTELDRVKAYPIPLDDLSVVAQSEGMMQKNQIDVVPLLRKIASAVIGEERVTKLSYQGPDQGDLAVVNYRAGAPAAPRPAPRPGAATAPGVYEIKLSVDLGSVARTGADIEAAVADARHLLDRLKSQFPDCAIQLTQLPSNAVGARTIEGGNTGHNASADEAARAGAQATYTIRKDS